MSEQHAVAPGRCPPRRRASHETSRLLATGVLTLALASCTESARGDQQLHVMIAEGHDYLESRQAELKASFPTLYKDHYDWDQDTRQIVFSSEGTATVVASFQIVGDISALTNTWLWAWANPTVDEALKGSSREVYELGQRNHLERLVTAKWPAGEADGWDMTGVAAKVVQASGAYRTCGKEGCEFLLLMNVRAAPPGFLWKHGEQARVR